MTGKTLLEVRSLAKAEAERRGHQIKRWNRNGAYRYTAICVTCRANIAVFAQAVDHGVMPDFSNHEGTIVARDSELYWTGRDYNWAQGEALRQLCWR